MTTGGQLQTDDSLLQCHVSMTELYMHLSIWFGIPKFLSMEGANYLITDMFYRRFVCLMLVVLVNF